MSLLRLMICLAVLLPGLGAFGQEAQIDRDPLEFLSVPSGALDGFFRALDGTDGARPPVILHYGDSHSATGWFTDSLGRALVGDRPLSPGFISVRYPLDAAATLKKRGRWRTDNWLRGRDRGPFGPYGIAFSTRSAEAYMELQLHETSAGSRQVTCFFGDSGASLPWRMEAEGAAVHFDPSAPSSPREPGAEVIGALELVVPARVDRVRLMPECRRGRCEEGRSLRIFGCLVRHDDAVLEVDTLAVGGTTQQNPLRRGGPEQLAYVRRRAPALLSLWFGTNNTGEKDFDPERYREQQRALVERLRSASPGASCLIIGLPDRSSRPSECFLDRKERRIAEKARRKRSKSEEARLALHRPERLCNPDALVRFEKHRNRYPVEGIRSPLDWELYKDRCAWHSMPIVLEIGRIQREVALAQGCAFFDAYSAMGGDGAIQRWACEDPPRARADLVHLMPDGYRQLGRTLAAGLLAARRESHLAGQGH